MPVSSPKAGAWEAKAERAPAGCKARGSRVHCPFKRGLGHGGPLGSRWENNLWRVHCSFKEGRRRKVCRTHSPPLLFKSLMPSADTGWQQQEGGLAGRRGVWAVFQVSLWSRIRTHLPLQGSPSVDGRFASRGYCCIQYHAVGDLLPIRVLPLPLCLFSFPLPSPVFPSAFPSLQQLPAPTSGGHHSPHPHFLFHLAVE